MEKMNLHHLGLFLDSDIIVLKEESHLQKTAPGEGSDVPGKKSFEEPEVSAVEELELVYEGNYEKGILVIYQGSHLDPALREFLFKILQAVSCSLKDVALSSSESVEEIPMPAIQGMAANKVIVFGQLRHELMNFRKHAYEILNEDGVEYLFADDIQEISENLLLKKSLWEKLQVLFNIKK